MTAPSPETLRLAREIAGLSPSQAEGMIGTWPEHIYSIEAGRTRVGGYLAVQLAELYDVNLMWLYGCAEPQTTHDLDCLHPDDRERVATVLASMRRRPTSTRHA